jgi:hypothetical protein
MRFLYLVLGDLIIVVIIVVVVIVIERRILALDAAVRIVISRVAVSGIEFLAAVSAGVIHH